MCNERYFLPSTNDNTDRTADIQQMLEQHGVCMLGDGVYVVSGVDMPKSSALMGVGAATKVLLNETVQEGYAVRLNSYCTVKDMHVMGCAQAIERPTEVGKRHGLMFLGDATPKQFGGQHRNSIITGCIITAFAGGGITCHDTGYVTMCSLTVSDCHILNCGAGINIDHFSEFHKFTNVLSETNLYGCINNGGNNVFVNCGFNSNTTAFLIDNSQKQSPNCAHGSAVGCTFNHSGGNKGVGIKILGAKPGYIFSGCQLFYSKIVLEDSWGVVFEGMNFGKNMDISIQGGTLTMFSNSSFSNLPASIHVEDNPHVKFINCFTRDEACQEVGL